MKNKHIFLVYNIHIDYTEIVLYHFCHNAIEIYLKRNIFLEYMHFLVYIVLYISKYFFIDNIASIILTDNKKSK